MENVDGYLSHQMNSVENKKSQEQKFQKSLYSETHQSAM